VTDALLERLIAALEELRAEVAGLRDDLDGGSSALQAVWLQ
jgi:hypothetical protein